MTITSHRTSKALDLSSVAGLPLPPQSKVDWNKWAILVRFASDTLRGLWAAIQIFGLLRTRFATD